MENTQAPFKCNFQSFLSRTQKGFPDSSCKRRCSSNVLVDLKPSTNTTAYSDMCGKNTQNTFTDT